MDPDDTIIDLTERRGGTFGEAPIPDYVRDEMEAAARLWHELRAERRAPGLREAITPSGDDPGAAA
jgi:hypothetical protein